MSHKAFAIEGSIQGLSSSLLIRNKFVLFFEARFPVVPCHQLSSKVEWRVRTSPAPAGTSRRHLGHRDVRLRKIPSQPVGGSCCQLWPNGRMTSGREPVPAQMTSKARLRSHSRNMSGNVVDNST